MPKSVLRDLTGQRFGRLLVIERAPSAPSGATYWKVRCDEPCGAERVVASVNLTQGRTTSCGAHSATHGQAGGRPGSGRIRSGAYKSWVGMLSRCTNPKHVKYPDYGGRGIIVCERWRSFENFYIDMGDRPPGMTIERKDVNGNYEPGNCCWAGSREQSRNKRSTVVTFNGVQEIIGRFEHGEGKASIARRFNLDPRYVGNIINGKTWPEIDRPYLRGAP